jgi:DNA-binding transcriptional MerR regulator/methylmalonyl-CoA mutase cobalamin-binding subunit
MSDVQYSIKAVAQKTGLSTHVLRVWEKRYGAVTPVRTGSNRRVYTDHEVERFMLLRRATQAGHSISHIARLSDDSLRELTAPQAFLKSRPEAAADKAQAIGQSHLPRCIDAIQKLDHQALEQVLTEAMIDMGHQALLTHLISPLTNEVGELWRDGTLTVAHEHFASATIRTFLWNASRPYAIPETAPNLIVATPSGQLHELGAVIVAALARNQGWRVTYLGTSLPAAEIAGAARQNGARAVLLSVVYPEDDPNLPAELANLRRFLAADTALFVGGRAAGFYREALDAADAKVITTLEELYPALEELRGKRNNP